METVTSAVERLKGNEEDPATRKIVRGVSQALRKDKITEELDGYVKSLSWYLDSFTVRVCGCWKWCKPFRSITLTTIIAFHAHFGVH